MMGNDQKSAWDHHLGVRTINFGDLGCPGRYSGWESDENPRCGIESENDQNVFVFEISQKKSNIFASIPDLGILRIYMEIAL